MGGKQMDNKLKRALAEAYRAPEPVGKAAFLKRHRRRELGRWELAAVQAAYIRWWVWALSLGLFGVILWAAAWTEGAAPWYAAALTPFLALLAVAEGGKGGRCRMDELELACRIPRQSVLLARMTALGAFHLALLAGLAPALAAWGAAGATRAGAYLLTPYLLTAALGMELTRRIRGREGVLACGGVAALVSGLGAVLERRLPAVYQPERLPLWGLALALAALAAGAEIILSLKERELQWN